MAIDLDRVEERAAYIRAQVKDVSQLMKSRPLEEILGDPWLRSHFVTVSFTDTSE